MIEVVAIAILVTVVVTFVVIVTRPKEHFMALEDVIPEGRIVSHEDGIVEYNGVYYVLGKHDLYKRRKLLGKIPDGEIQGPCIVDMRFNSQIIIKKGPVNDRVWSGPGEFE